MSPKFLIIAVTASLCAGSVAFADESGTQRPRPRPQQQQQIPDDYDDYDQQDQGYQQDGYQQGYAYGYQQQGCYRNCGGAPAVLPITPIYPQPYVGTCVTVFYGNNWQIWLNNQPILQGFHMGQLGQARQQLIVQRRCIFRN